MTAAAVSGAVAAGIVGNSFVRAAAAGDAVGGVVPSLVVSPATEEEVAAVLAWASRDGLAVAACGGGTKMAWGAPPRRCDVVLSTLRLAGVVEHEPGDLVCVVRAGTPLADVQALVGVHGQRLALDPPHGVAATIGGIVATGAWGPLRTHYGTARDLVLGCRFVLADGTVGHSGGKVVKNVAGYDVAKLLIGSLGTLAVITEVSLRLHPVARASRTVVCGPLPPADVAAACRAVVAAPVVPVAMVALLPEGTVLVQVEGTEAGVAAQVEVLGSVAPLSRVLSDAEATAAWEHARVLAWGGDDASDAADAVASVAVPRAHLDALITVLGTEATRAVVLPSLGIAAAQGDHIVALRTWAASLGGHAVLHRAPPDLASLAWPAVADPAVTLMRAVKQSLDPAATLSPGRHLGGI
ncbi:MAG TPA: FAD-binding oxidoreductase [Candidatus Dormibacteraeota bacterium]|nr:FAD-binding oxidoreductase [Candidatus Dormibacteraeota bacterium]